MSVEAALQGYILFYVYVFYLFFSRIKAFDAYAVFFISSL